MVVKTGIEFLDNFSISPDYLSQEHNLIRPDLNNSIAGFMPELLYHWNVDLSEKLPDNLVENSRIASKLENSFPSGYDNIVFILTDALGVYHLSKLGGAIWDNITSQGTIATSCFPTMTATVMTSISYGLHPADHGILGYNHYNENVGEIWNALNLQYRKGDGEMAMVLDDFKLSDLVSGNALTNTILDTGVPIRFYMPIELQPPGLGNLINPSLTTLSYENIPQVITNVAQELSHKGPRITVVYLPHADHAAHMHGPESSHYEEAIRGIEKLIEATTQHPSIQSGDTLVALTSDHGQVQIDHSISKWMTQQERLELINQGVMLSTSGRVIHAYSSVANRYKAEQVLEKLVNGKGIILETELALELNGENNTHSQRLGNLLAIYEDTYLYDVPEIGTQTEGPRLHGQHGSLTPQELYVPVGIWGGNS